MPLRVCLDPHGGIPPPEEVLLAMAPWLRSPASAGALHHRGIRARECLERARDTVRHFLGCPASADIVFTSGGTEALHLAIQGVAKARHPEGRHEIVYHAGEHPAVLAAIEQSRHLSGILPVPVPCLRNGLADLATFQQRLGPRTLLAVLQWVNQDMAAIQPVRELAAFAQASGTRVLCHASFGAGWLLEKPGALHADVLVVAPHRFGGPLGCGILALAPGITLAPMLTGGLQENGLRAGNENLPAIAGSAAACTWAERTLPERFAAATHYRAMLQQHLETLGGWQLLGAPPAGSAPHFFLGTFDGVEGEALALALDLAGVEVGAASACFPGAQKPAPALAAMGLSARQLRGAIAMGTAQLSSEAAVDAAATEISRIVRRLRHLAPAGARPA